MRGMKSDWKRWSRVEQILLHRLPMPPGRDNATRDDRISCGSDNAHRYLASLGANLDDRDISDLRALLSGIMAEFDRAPVPSLQPKP